MAALFEEESERLKTTRIHISIPEQRLSLLSGGRVVRTYDVSTAKNGAGEQVGSGCTPRELT